MAQVQVEDDYGTRTCVLCLTHCASSWTLNRHVQGSHPQYVTWYISEKEKILDTRPFTANTAFAAAAYASEGHHITEVGQQAERSVFAQEERRRPKVVQADCQTIMEPEATN